MARQGTTSPLTLLVAALVASAAPGQTYYVRQGGNDQADGKTAAGAFRTPLRAAQAVNHGDSIVIGPGVYRGAALLAERFSADGARMSVLGDESSKVTGDPPGTVVLEPANATEPAWPRLAAVGIRSDGASVRRKPTC